MIETSLTRDALVAALGGEGAELFGVTAAVADDGYVVVSTDEDALSAAVGQLGTEPSSAWRENADAQPLMEFVDRGATLWGLAHGTALATVRDAARDGELPRDLRRLVRTLEGAAISVNLNEGIHVLAVLMFADSDGGERARRHLDAIRDEFGPRLRQAGEWGDDALQSLVVEQDGRFVTLVLELEPELAARIVAAAGHLASAR